jgi:Cft2 family RNA processing exonuclease
MRVLGTPLYINDLTARGAPEHYLTSAQPRHCVGLTAQWSGPLICCSVVTKELLISKYGDALLPYIESIEIGKTYRLIETGPYEANDPRRRASLRHEKAHRWIRYTPEVVVPRTYTVRVFDSKHCPGSVMFFFESAHWGNILHTGDLNYDPAVHLDCPTGRVDRLYIDTTLCDAKGSFPSNVVAESLKSLKARVDQHTHTYGRGLTRIESDEANTAAAAAAATVAAADRPTRVYLGLGELGSEALLEGVAKHLDTKHHHARLFIDLVRFPGLKMFYHHLSTITFFQDRITCIPEEANMVLLHIVARDGFEDFVSEEWLKREQEKEEHPQKKLMSDFACTWGIKEFLPCQRNSTIYNADARLTSWEEHSSVICVLHVQHSDAVRTAAFINRVNPFTVCALQVPMGFVKLLAADTAFHDDQDREVKERHSELIARRGYQMTGNDDIDTDELTTAECNFFRAHDKEGRRLSEVNSQLESCEANSQPVQQYLIDTLADKLTCDATIIRSDVMVLCRPQIPLTVAAPQVMQSAATAIVPRAAPSAAAAAAPRAAPATRCVEQGRAGRLDGTSIAVDHFVKNDGVHVWRFLTHAHTDHTKGLNSNWDHGPIFSTATTRALTLLQCARYAHKDLMPYERSMLTTAAKSGENTKLAKCMRVLEVGTIKAFTEPSAAGSAASSSVPPRTFTVRLFDSNHCPGSAMFFFESAHWGNILHTGDFRWDATQFADAHWPVGRVDRLYLDTTFCDDIFFPPEDASSDETVRFMREAHAKATAAGQACRAYLSCDMLGLERWLIAVLHKLKVSIYIDVSKPTLRDRAAELQIASTLNGYRGLQGRIITDPDLAAQTWVHLAESACRTFTEFVANDKQRITIAEGDAFELTHMHRVPMEANIYVRASAQRFVLKFVHGPIPLSDFDAKTSIFHSCITIHSGAKGISELVHNVGGPDMLIAPIVVPSRMAQTTIGALHPFGYTVVEHVRRVIAKCIAERHAVNVPALAQSARIRAPSPHIDLTASPTKKARLSASVVPLIANDAPTVSACSDADTPIESATDDITTPEETEETEESDSQYVPFCGNSGE